jgi:hypothetical protein
MNHHRVIVWIEGQTGWHRLVCRTGVFSPSAPPSFSGKVSNVKRLSPAAFCNHVVLKFDLDRLRGQGLLFAL